MITKAFAHMENITTPSAAWGNHLGGCGMAGQMQNMMGGWFTQLGWLAVIFWWLTWILIIAALVALIRWLWKQGEK